ncbi:MAG: polyvinylalcohol dehydrogenase [Verrucomicrobia bacterium]|nr:polyvinylalcohol dehydrogenase [Verrucomicrobiota bacterium]
MLHLKLPAAWLVIASNIFLCAYAGDWPQWRGPKRDGVSTETGLLKQWPANGPPLLWKAQELGGGYSTPSVSAGRVIGTGYRGADDVVWAVDAETGKLLWTTRLGKADESFDMAEGPRSTPAIDGDLVYTLGGGGNLVCLESATGREAWKKHFKDEFGGRMMSGWGFSESPLVDGDKLVCTPGGSRGSIVALNKKTGALLWQTTEFKDRAAYSSVITAEIGGVRQYIQLTGDSLVGVNPADGQLLWKAARRGETAVVPTPIFYDDHVYVTSGYGVGCNLFKITRAAAKFSAREIYANEEMQNHHGGVIRVGEHVYGHSDSRGWICQEFKTGKVVWSNRGVGKGGLVCADGHLYLRSEGGKGTVALVEATPQGYREKGRFDQPNRSRRNSWSHPVVANGQLYLRDQDVLLCYNVKP